MSLEQDPERQLPWTPYLQAKKEEDDEVTIYGRKFKTGIKSAKQPTSSRIKEAAGAGQVDILDTLTDAYENPVQYLPWASAYTEARDANELLNAVSVYQESDTDSYEYRQAAEVVSEYLDEMLMTKTGGAQFLDLVLSLPKYQFEFGVGRAAAGVKGLSRQAIGQMVRELTEEAAQGKAKKSVLGRFMKGQAYKDSLKTYAGMDLAPELTRLIGGHGGRPSGAIYQRQLDINWNQRDKDGNKQAPWTRNELGQLEVFLDAEIEPWIQAAPFALADRYIETLSEGMGGSMGMKAAQTRLALGAKKVPGLLKLKSWQHQTVGDFMKRRNLTRFAEVADSVLIEGGWDGMWEEWLEERFGSNLRTITMVGEDEFLLQWKDGSEELVNWDRITPDWEQWGIELAAFFLPGGGMTAADMALNKEDWSFKRRMDGLMALAAEDYRPHPATDGVQLEDRPAFVEEKGREPVNDMELLSWTDAKYQEMAAELQAEAESEIEDEFDPTVGREPSQEEEPLTQEEVDADTQELEDEIEWRREEAEQQRVQASSDFEDYLDENYPDETGRDQYTIEKLILENEDQELRDLAVDVRNESGRPRYPKVREDLEADIDLSGAEAGSIAGAEAELRRMNKGRAVKIKPVLGPSAAHRGLGRASEKRYGVKIKFFDAAVESEDGEMRSDGRIGGFYVPGKKGKPGTVMINQQLAASFDSEQMGSTILHELWHDRWKRAPKFLQEFLKQAREIAPERVAEVEAEVLKRYDTTDYTAEQIEEEVGAHVVEQLVAVHALLSSSSGAGRSLLTDVALQRRSTTEALLDGLKSLVGVFTGDTRKSYQGRLQELSEVVGNIAPRSQDTGYEVAPVLRDKEAAQLVLLFDQLFEMATLGARKVQSEQAQEEQELSDADDVLGKIGDLEREEQELAGELAGEEEVEDPSREGLSDKAVAALEHLDRANPEADTLVGSYNRPVLVELAKHFGVKTSGTKPQLAERILAAHKALNPSEKPLTKRQPKSSRGVYQRTLEDLRELGYDPDEIDAAMSVLWESVDSNQPALMLVLMSEMGMDITEQHLGSVREVHGPQSGMDGMPELFSDELYALAEEEAGMPIKDFIRAGLIEHLRASTQQKRDFAEGRVQPLTDADIVARADQAVRKSGELYHVELDVNNEADWAWLQATHKKHHGFAEEGAELNYRGKRHAIASFKGVELQAAAVLNTPSARHWAEEGVAGQVIELTRVIAVGDSGLFGGDKRASSSASAITREAVEYAKNEGKTLITFSQVTQQGSPYRALANIPDGYSLIPTGVGVGWQPSQKDSDGQVRVPKVRWMAGPLAQEYADKDLAGRDWEAEVDRLAGEYEAAAQAAAPRDLGQEKLRLQRQIQEAEEAPMSAEELEELDRRETLIDNRVLKGELSKSAGEMEKRQLREKVPAELTDALRDVEAEQSREQESMDAERRLLLKRKAEHEDFYVKARKKINSLTRKKPLKSPGAAISFIADMVELLEAVEVGKRTGQTEQTAKEAQDLANMLLKEAERRLSTQHFAMLQDMIARHRSEQETRARTAEASDRIGRGEAEEGDTQILMAGIDAELKRHRETKPYVYIVTCGQAKRSVQSKAADMYTSATFTLSKKLATKRTDQWMILSGKHGLLDPDQLIDPYNETLKKGQALQKALSDPNSRESQIAKSVGEQAWSRFGPDVNFVILGPRHYVTVFKHGLRKAAEEVISGHHPVLYGLERDNVQTPLSGKTIIATNKWLKQEVSSKKTGPKKKPKKPRARGPKANPWAVGGHHYEAAMEKGEIDIITWLQANDIKLNAYFFNSLWDAYKDSRGRHGGKGSGFLPKLFDAPLDATPGKIKTEWDQTGLSPDALIDHLRGTRWDSYLPVQDLNRPDEGFDIEELLVEAWSSPGSVLPKEQEEQKIEEMTEEYEDTQLAGWLFHVQNLLDDQASGAITLDEMDGLMEDEYRDALLHWLENPDDLNLSKEQEAQAKLINSRPPELQAPAELRERETGQTLITGEDEVASVTKEQIASLGQERDSQVMSEMSPGGDYRNANQAAFANVWITIEHRRQGKGAMPNKPAVLSAEARSIIGKDMPETLEELLRVAWGKGQKSRVSPRIIMALADHLAYMSSDQELGVDDIAYDAYLRLNAVTAYEDQLGVAILPWDFTDSQLDGFNKYAEGGYTDASLLQESQVDVAELRKRETGQRLITGEVETEEVTGERPGIDVFPKQASTEIGMFDEQGGLFEEQAKERDQGTAAADTYHRDTLGESGVAAYDRFVEMIELGEGREQEAKEIADQIGREALEEARKEGLRRRDLEEPPFALRRRPAFGGPPVGMPAPRGMASRPYNYEVRLTPAEDRWFAADFADEQQAESVSGANFYRDLGIDYSDGVVRFRTYRELMEFVDTTVTRHEPESLRAQGLPDRLPPSFYSGTFGQKAT